MAFQQNVSPIEICKQLTYFTTTNRPDQTSRDHEWTTIQPNRTFNIIDFVTFPFLASNLSLFCSFISTLQHRSHPHPPPLPSSASWPKNRGFCAEMSVQGIIMAEWIDSIRFMPTLSYDTARCCCCCFFFLLTYLSSTNNCRGRWGGAGGGELLAAVQNYIPGCRTNCL